MARERCTRDSRYGDPPPPRQATSSRLRWLAVKTPNVRALATGSQEVALSAKLSENMPPARLWYLNPAYRLYVWAATGHTQVHY